MRYSNEFLYNSKDAQSNGDRVQVGSFDSQGSFSSVPFSQYLDQTECLSPLPGALSIPHSASFADIDGDCMPDLFLTRTVYSQADSAYVNIYEVYIQRLNNQYCLA